MSNYFSRGKLAIITGAASGIGEQLARSLVARGMSLVICDIDGKRLEELSNELSVDYALCDVRYPHAVSELAQNIQQNFSEPVGAVFANAGVMKTGKIDESTADDWKFMIDVNIMGVANTIRYLVPVLKSQSIASRFIATASVAGLVSAPMSGAYNATKHAVVSMCETLHQETKVDYPQLGISVICPGAVKTDILNTKKYGIDEGNVGYHNRMKQLMAEKGASTQDMVETSLSQIEQGKFWIFPQKYVFDRFRVRSDSILNQTGPEWFVNKN